MYFFYSFLWVLRIGQSKVKGSKKIGDNLKIVEVEVLEKCIGNKKYVISNE